MPVVITDVLCNRTTRTGNACSNKALQGQEYCFAHDPAAKERNKRAARRLILSVRLKSASSDALWRSATRF